MRNERNGMKNRKYSMFNILCSIYRDRRGFTLIEVLLSLAVIGGLLVTLIYTLNYHLGIAERHEVITVAVDLAKEKMRDLEKAPSTDSGNFDEPYSDFTYETFVNESLFPGMVEIGVTVRHDHEVIKIAKLVEGRE
jgi:general secretion pathway protein I